MQGAWVTPGQETRSHMWQIRVHMPQLKTAHADTKTQRSQITKKEILQASSQLIPTATRWGSNDYRPQFTDEKTVAQSG